MSNRLSIFFIIILSSIIAFGQQQDTNYDESKVPEYFLPDPLLNNDGVFISTSEEWFEKRRPEILQLFETEVYGKAPGFPQKMEFKTILIDTSALEGKAIRKEIALVISNQNRSLTLNLLVYLPKNGQSKHPIFLGLNFYGNQTICNDTGISITNNWVNNNKKFEITNNKATETTRGIRAHRWQVKYLLSQGYGLATMYYGDIDPDFNDGFQNGIHSLFNENGQRIPEANEWGSIAAWAWGLSRAMDYLVTDSLIDHKKIAVMGHSRLGKTSLWAGAQDGRFAIVISNNSGCGGAALSRRRFGETVERINNSFPHWFCGNFKKYNNNEGILPIDQHLLIGLIAPRPVYVASAEQDNWADPKGEFLSAENAQSVYKLFGKKDVLSDEIPKVNNPVGDIIGYHVRSGKHDVTIYDWEQYINFANRHYGFEKN
jgi:hypothetical protein